MSKLKGISIKGMVLVTCILSIALFIYSKVQSKNIENTSIGIIGGADGPTQIYVSSGNDSLLIIGVTTIITSILLITIKAVKKSRKG